MAFDGNMVSFSNVKSFMRFREGKKRSKKRKKGKRWPSRNVWKLLVFQTKIIPLGRTQEDTEQLPCYMEALPTS